MSRLVVMKDFLKSWLWNILTRCSIRISGFFSVLGGCTGVYPAAAYCYWSASNYCYC